MEKFSFARIVVLQVMFNLVILANVLYLQWRLAARRERKALKAAAADCRIDGPVATAPGGVDAVSPEVTGATADGSAVPVPSGRNRRGWFSTRREKVRAGNRQRREVRSRSRAMLSLDLSLPDVDAPDPQALPRMDHADGAAGSLGAIEALLAEAERGDAGPVSGRKRTADEAARAVEAAQVAHRQRAADELRANIRRLQASLVPVGSSEALRSPAGTAERGANA